MKYSVQTNTALINLFFYQNSVSFISNNKYSWDSVDCTSSKEISLVVPESVSVLFSDGIAFSTQSNHKSFDKFKQMIFSEEEGRGQEFLCFHISLTSLQSELQLP